MIIRKINQNEISLETSKSKALIELKSNTISIKIESASTLVKLSMPGEYEYGDISATCLELSLGHYTGIINFLKLDIEGMRIGIIISETPSDKEAFKNLDNLDILIIKNNFNNEIIKKFINYFDVLNLIIVNGEDLDVIKHSLGLANVTQEKTLTIKLADLKREETSVISGYLL